ncbi:MAG TPA: UbiA family prenyltransferase [Stackebrandtia sp.]|uniref:UbiA family prenyltransferase n=1 Tax=Stackebrandtia sp. TaxID=2023065 RepID=UPI002D68BEC6|nr:UbiA family prenyltransferase [Stackebrandtia sp.]HZE41185.1 UbiA family prenyltransferase [Stackebrandtia sp.]
MRSLALLRACHPGPVAVVTLVATGIAAASGRPWWQTLSVFAAVLCGQLSVGWSNDAFDAERDLLAQRTDKPAATGRIATRVLWRCAIAAGIAAVPLSFLVGAPGVFHIVGVLGGWMYNVSLKATAWSPLPYAMSFGLLVTYAAAHPRVWTVAAGALLGTAAHFANTLSDLDDDIAMGIRGLPHRLGAMGSRIAAAVLLVGAGVIAGLHIAGGWGIGVLVASGLGGAAAVALPGGRAVFRVVMGLALVDALALLVAVAL